MIVHFRHNTRSNKLHKGRLLGYVTDNNVACAVINCDEHAEEPLLSVPLCCVYTDRNGAEKAICNHDDDDGQE